MGERNRLAARWAMGAAFAWAAAGCGKALPIGFEEEAPDGRIHAIVEAARKGDRGSLGLLVEQLDSDDPAVRLFAIRTIERISGRRFGYDHAAGLAAREAAIRSMIEELGLRDSALGVGGTSVGMGGGGEGVDRDGER